MQMMKSSEKKKIVKLLEEQYGIKELPYLLLQFGKGKIRLYSGNLSREELAKLDCNLNIENIGLYFAKEENDGVRLTLDGIYFLKDFITKNILEVSDKDAEDWMRGQDILLKHQKGYFVLKNNNDLIGCGKSTGEKITNFMPKERRVK